jgi:hypothetical protein
MRSIACWALMLGLIAMSTSSVALADARDHFRRGQAAYQQGNYDLAISEWLSGYELEQRPEFQYNLAQAYERLGRLQDAVNSLQRFVESADPDDSSYSDATARLASLQQRLALTGVRVLGGQDGATIFVDGRDWGRLPRPDKISVSPGSHQIVVKLAGFKDFVSNVVIPAGQVIDIEITMEAGESTVGATPTTTTTTGTTGTTTGVTLTPGTSTLPPDTASRGTSPWLYVGIGAGAVTLVSLIGLAAQAGKVSECEKAENFCPDQSTVESQRTGWAISTVVFGAATIGSFVLFALDRREPEATSAAATCVPGLTGGMCTVTF